MTLRHTRTLSIVAAALLLAACGSHDSHSGSTAVSVDGSAAFNDADGIFAQEMIPHHEQAIELSEYALDPKAGASEAVKGLAGRIEAGQDPEVTLMKGWLKEWGQPTMDELPEHDMSTMEGMVSEADMKQLATLTGAEFDAAWLKAMIAHHEGALKMAKDVKAEGKHPDVAELADAVIAAQTAEIEEMSPLVGD